MSRTPRPRLLRNNGYATLCTVLALTFTAIGVLAAVDPNTPPSGDPPWLGWTLLACVFALMVRAWFIGVRVTDTHVVRHGWVHNATLDRDRVAGVGSVNYTGLWLLDTSLVAMVVLRLADQSEVEVPELAGRHNTVWRLVDQLQADLNLVPDSTRGGPR